MSKPAIHEAVSAVIQQLRESHVEQDLRRKVAYLVYAIEEIDEADCSLIDVANDLCTAFETIKNVHAYVEGEKHMNGDDDYEDEHEYEDIEAEVADDDLDSGLAFESLNEALSPSPYKKATKKIMQDAKKADYDRRMMQDIKYIVSKLESNDPVDRRVILKNLDNWGSAVKSLVMKHIKGIKDVDA